MTDLEVKYKELKERRLRRKRAWSHLFVAPLVGLWVAAGLLQDTVYFPLVAVVAAPVFCYLQARYLKMPSPLGWGVAGFFFNIGAMIYLLGYARGRGLPKADP